MLSREKMNDQANSSKYIRVEKGYIREKRKRLRQLSDTDVSGWVEILECRLVRGREIERDKEGG